MARIAPIGNLTLSQQRLENEDTAIDLVGTRQRLRARKVSRPQQPLRIHGRGDGLEVHRQPMALDHHRAPVPEFDPPHDVDAAGPEADLRDRAAESVLGVRAEEGQHLGHRFGPEIRRSVPVISPAALVLSNADRSVGEPIPRIARSVSVISPPTSVRSNADRSVGDPIIEACHDPAVDLAGRDAHETMEGVQLELG